MSCNLSATSALCSKSDYNGALAILDKEIALNPNDTVTLRRRSWCYNELGLHKQALVDCDKLLSTNHADFEAYGERAKVNSALEKFDQAIADWTQQIDLQPQNSEPYYLRGYDCTGSGKSPAAIDDFTKAIALYEAHPPEADDDNGELNGLMMLEGAFAARGAIHFALSEFSESVNDYTQAIRQNESLNSPSTYRHPTGVTFGSDYYASRAAAYDKLGKYDLATVDKKKAQEQNKILAEISARVRKSPEHK